MVHRRLATRRGRRSGAPQSLQRAHASGTDAQAMNGGTMRYLVTILLMAAGAAAGYFGRELVASRTFDIKIPFPDPGYSPSTFELGCTAVMEAAAFEDRFTGPSANARAGRATEKLALK